MRTLVKRQLYSSTNREKEKRKNNKRVLSIERKEREREKKVLSPRRFSPPPPFPLSHIDSFQSVGRVSRSRARIIIMIISISNPYIRHYLSQLDIYIYFSLFFR
jgi:hypothetical protein